jgi:ribosomal protein S18 acetylase RimI-like enzyme
MGLSASTLTAAIEANILDHVRAVASRSPQVELYDQPDLLWISSGIAHPYLNRVYQALFRTEDVDERIEETLSYFESRGSPVSWHVGPSSEPWDLGKRLETAGLVRLEDEIGMALDLSSFGRVLEMPVGLEMEVVADAQGLRSWVDVVIDGFGRPARVESALYDVYEATGFGQDAPWRLYLGSMEGEPVGTSRVFFSDKVAGVYHVATRPRARRQGIGTAMTIHTLRDAQELGYEIAVLRAAQAALGIYLRLGFREYCTFSRYLRARGDEPIGSGSSDRSSAVG